jgi:hypothetical protein
MPDNVRVRCEFDSRTKTLMVSLPLCPDCGVEMRLNLDKARVIFECSEHGELQLALLDERTMQTILEVTIPPGGQE